MKQLVLFLIVMSGLALRQDKPRVFAQAERGPKTLPPPEREQTADGHAYTNIAIDQESPGQSRSSWLAQPSRE
jgi:hypothetical protein